MLYHERKEKTLALFQNKTTLKVAEIAAALEVSVDTVRRDLKQMEQENLVKYIFGGAILNEEAVGQYGGFSSREIKNKDLKREACKKALGELKANDVVFINSGTTGAVLAEELARSCVQITVITNSLEAANVLMQAGNTAISVTCLGGQLDMTEKSVYGHTCEQELMTYYPDVCFLSINAIDQQGYTDFRTHEMGIMKLAQKNAKRVVAVMDSTKFGRRSQKLVFAPHEIDAVYCDSQLSLETVAEYQEQGIMIV